MAYAPKRSKGHKKKERLLHWAVIMGRVSTEPEKKMPLRSIGYI